MCFTTNKIVAFVLLVQLKNKLFWLLLIFWTLYTLSISSSWCLFLCVVPLGNAWFRIAIFSPMASVFSLKTILSQEFYRLILLPHVSCPLILLLKWNYLCWQPLDKPNLCCQRGARLGMRLAKVVVDGRGWLRYLATSP